MKSKLEALMMSLPQIAPHLQRDVVAGADTRSSANSRLIRNGLRSAGVGDSRRRVLHRHHHVTRTDQHSSWFIAAGCNFNKFIWRVPIYIRLTWVHKRACCSKARSGLRAAVAHYAVSGFEWLLASTTRCLLTAYLSRQLAPAVLPSTLLRPAALLAGCVPTAVSLQLFLSKR
ncbi:MAG TPA: hypothetical protein VMG12_05835 [Polyangiaceae bacterium]|nr:hypothetical protein [Polyangiaceae bacterium]